MDCTQESEVLVSFGNALSMCDSPPSCGQGYRSPVTSRDSPDIIPPTLTTQMERQNPQPSMSQSVVPETQLSNAENEGNQEMSYYGETVGQETECLRASEPHTSYIAEASQDMSYIDEKIEGKEATCIHQPVLAVNNSHQGVELCKIGEVTENCNDTETNDMEGQDVNAEPTVEPPSATEKHPVETEILKSQDNVGSSLSDDDVIEVKVEKEREVIVLDNSDAETNDSDETQYIAGHEHSDPDSPESSCSQSLLKPQAKTSLTRKKRQAKVSRADAEITVDKLPVRRSQRNREKLSWKASLQYEEQKLKKVLVFCYHVSVFFLITYA